MTKLLVVETSPRGDHSISRGLTRRFVAKWRAAHPDGDVVDRDLMETDLQFIGAPWLQAYFAPSRFRPKFLGRSCRSQLSVSLPISCSARFPPMISNC